VSLSTWKTTWAFSLRELHNNTSFTNASYFVHSVVGIHEERLQGRHKETQIYFTESQ